MAMLDGKVAFITGGASGIGRAAALRFAREGADIAIADLIDAAGHEARHEIERTGGGEALYVHCDVSDDGQTRAAIEQAVQRFGRLDIVMANAGINGVWAPIDDLTLQEWDRTIAINLRGTFLTLHHAVGPLKRSGGGSVIITSSVNGTRTFSNPGLAAYSASKAGQIALMKQAALELARHNIRVNAICPGGTSTNIGLNTDKRNLESIDIRVDLPDGHPALHGGHAEPPDVADVCLFLASDLSRHVSGAEIYVDGGASLLR